MEKKILSNMYINSSSGLPNFFDFIEADVNKIFGENGKFIIFNIFNLTMVNERYGRDIGDICIKGICESISNVVSRYVNVYGFRFGKNDFMITLPNYQPSNINEIVIEVKEEFKKIMDVLGFSSAELNHSALEYSEKIECVEDFYELLFNNAPFLGESKEATRRIVRHIIGTFTSSIRTTISSYNNANTLALKDDISGLSNHRAGKLFLSGLIEEHSQKRRGFTVMFIDGDNLKRYNKISYESGNEMIRNLSQIISNSIRQEDRVFRWLSGDEFLVVLKEVDKNSSLKLAERIRESVEIQTKECIYPTTISIGLAHYPSDGTSIEDIITKAEKANSYAKDIGRNKVVKWESIIEIIEE